MIIRRGQWVTVLVGKADPQPRVAEYGIAFDRHTRAGVVAEKEPHSIAAVKSDYISSAGGSATDQSIAGSVEQHAVTAIWDTRLRVVSDTDQVALNVVAGWVSLNNQTDAVSRIARDEVSRSRNSPSDR